MKALREVRNSNILLDANILIHYATEGFAERSGNVLRVLHQSKNLLSISHITAFELLRIATQGIAGEKNTSNLSTALKIIQLLKASFRMLRFSRMNVNDLAVNTSIPLTYQI